MKISNSSSLKKNRIHSSYVDRNTTINNTSPVESIDPINPIENQSAYSSANHLLSYDIYYDTLKDLKEEYRKFYHDEQLLEKAIEDFDENRDAMLNNMNELISKYNNAISSLESFDQVFNTNNVKNIVDILHDFKGPLNNLGISIINNKELAIDDNIFIEKIEDSNKALDFLFQPAKGLILKIYYAFKSIKVPRKKSLDKEYNNTNYTGMLLDSKS